MVMHEDIYTDGPTSYDTLSNLGPLTGMAGTWTGRGEDTHPEADGPETEPFIETITLEPIDAQTNGPQVFYGLRYHTFITRPGQHRAFHDQNGYWLWEPATGRILMTGAIPRGQCWMAVGQYEEGADSFTVEAVRGSITNGIVSNPFLEHAFRTESFRQTVKFHEDGTWSYDEVARLIIPGVEGEFLHRDTNRLSLIKYPTMNPRGIDEHRWLRG